MPFDVSTERRRRFAFPLFRHCTIPQFYYSTTRPLRNSTIRQQYSTIHAHYSTIPPIDDFRTPPSTIRQTQPIYDSTTLPLHHSIIRDATSLRFVESESCMSLVESEFYWAGLDSKSSRFRVQAVAQSGFYAGGGLLKIGVGSGVSPPENF